MSANPYIAFFTVAVKTGTLEFSWTGDNGFAQAERMALTVTP
jgi:sulfur-oxidizing protein SoxZ